MKTLIIVLSCTTLSFADGFERIGHTTLLPRHSNPDDRGMYAATIDPTNGYAYFVGEYLFKLDITGNLPVQVGPALDTGQAVEAQIDSEAGYLYLPKGTIYRYAVGTGTNPVTSAGSLNLAAGSAASIAIDSNHYAYVAISGIPGKVAKVDLTAFSELGSITLNPGESNFVFASVVDVPHGYAYFFARGGVTQQVVKVKFTPGTNAPVRIGAAALGTNVFVDGASIDTLHGFAYYGTYNSDTNVPGRVYKVKLGDGDVAPTLVGYTDLLSGEGRLSASVCDPIAGYVYFADDNTYPGHLYQLSLNGTNLPIEIGRVSFQPGWSNSPPNGVTIGNVTTNSDGILPFGEVFIRSAVFDSIRGYAYLGQDSRPNQVVKVRLSSAFDVAQSVDATNGFLTLTFTRDANTTDVSYIPETSDDLLTWTNVDQNVIASNAVTLTIRAQDSVPVSSAERRFMRLHIVPP